MEPTKNKARLNRKLILKLGVIVFAMLGFSYALIPLYDIICDITGLNGRTGVISGEVESKPVDLDRYVSVEFLSHINGTSGWTFTPDAQKIQVQPGKQYTMSYTATNLQDSSAVAQAVPSVAPVSAARHFNKIECFCFTSQAFKGNEQRALWVTFVVDPSLPQNIKVISLAYTFYDVTEKTQDNYDV